MPRVFVRRAVAVHVQVVPVGVDAGRRRRRLQGAGGLAPRAGGEARRAGVEVHADVGLAAEVVQAGHAGGAGSPRDAAGEVRSRHRRGTVVAADQPADVPAAADRPQRVAGHDLRPAVETRHQPAGEGDAVARAGDARGGVAGRQQGGRPAHPSHQPRHAGNAGRAGPRAARGPGRDHCSGELRHQRRDFGGAAADAAHLGVRHPQGAHRAAHSVEQGGVAGGVDDGQVGDRPVVALEGGGVGAADGRPVGEGVAGVHGAAAVVVEVEIVAQFVAGAGALAAHAGFGAGKGGGKDESGGGAGGRDAVAVQVIADGVQLGEGSDLDQVVVVVVVVEGAPLGVEVETAELQHRILGTGAEIPRVRVHRAVEVHILVVPNGVVARVAGWRLEGGGRSTRPVAVDLAPGTRVPVSRNSRAVTGRAVLNAHLVAASRQSSREVGRPDAPDYLSRNASAEIAAGVASAVHRGRRIARPYFVGLRERRRLALPNHATHVPDAGHPAGRPDAPDVAAQNAGHHAHIRVARHPSVRHPQRRYHGILAELREQSDLVLRRTVYEQVLDQVAVAAEPDVVMCAVVSLGLVPDGIPAGAAVVVGVAGIARAVDVRVAVAVGVEVQVVAQLVAGAGG